jgi:cytochrome b6-f complex iron-sulfur subunit
MKVKEENFSKENTQFLVTRRRLFKGLFTFLGGLGIGGILYGLWGFLSQGEGAHSPVEIPLSKIPIGNIYAFQYGGSPGILIHEEEGDLQAFSLTCTHLGCIVVWNPEKKEFHCPCHDGLFDINGKVLSGPPLSPLDRWKVKVDGEKVIVG